MICLRTGHHAKICKSFIKCLICSRRHVTVMCPDINRIEKKEEQQNNTNTVMPSSQVNTVILLQTIIVNVIDKNFKRISVRALIDTGAQRSYITENLAKKLGLQPMGEQSLVHQLFGGAERQSRKHKLYTICVENLDGSFKLNMDTLTETKICGSIPSVNRKLSLEMKRFNITISDVENANEIDLLIGADYIGKIMTDTFLTVSEGLVAIKTKFGWTLQGKVEAQNDSRVCSTLFSKSELDITDMWNLKAIGTRDKPTNVTETEVTAKFKKKFVS